MVSTRNTLIVLVIAHLHSIALCGCDLGASNPGPLSPDLQVLRPLYEVHANEWKLAGIEGTLQIEFEEPKSEFVTAGNYLPADCADVRIQFAVQSGDNYSMQVFCGEEEVHRFKAQRETLFFSDGSEYTWADLASEIGPAASSGMVWPNSVVKMHLFPVSRGLVYDKSILDSMITYSGLAAETKMDESLEEVVTHVAVGRPGLEDRYELLGGPNSRLLRYRFLLGKDEIEHCLYTEPTEFSGNAGNIPYARVLTYTSKDLGKITSRVVELHTTQ